MSFLRSIIYYASAPFRFLARVPLRAFGVPRRLMSMSVPARTAVMLAIFLILLTITAFVCFFLKNDRTHWSAWLNWTRIGMILLLLVATPLVVYQALKLWLEGEASRFPDIDQAWQEGMDALRANGLDVNHVPVFLILGVCDGQEADVLMRAAGFEQIVSSVPDGRAPLRWFANDDSAFIFCQAAGGLSRFNRLARAGGGGGGSGSPTSQPQTGITGTLIAGGGGITDTGPPAAAEPSESWSSGPSIQGTLVPGAQATITPGQAPSTDVSSPSGRMVSVQDLNQEDERLEHVCRLLVRARQPLCPLNGIATVIPLAALEDILIAKDLPDAIRRDLTTIRETCKLSCPVTTLITGMEREAGFSELVRRLGIKRAKESRFGKGFKVWDPPTSENMDALSSHACGAFEDWVYALFREDDGLNKPGNGKLYNLLCKIRGHLHYRLRGVLLNGYSTEAAGTSKPPMFSGCYFAATGSSEDRQAFVQSVFEKMIQQEEELEWTDRALNEDHRYHQLAQLVTVGNGLLIVVLIGMVIWKYWTR